MFKRGLPPAGVEKAWLLLRAPDADGVYSDSVALAVLVGGAWCKSDKWKLPEWAAHDVAQQVGCEIIGWKEYAIPEPVLEPSAVYDVYTDRAFFLHKQAAASEAEAVRLARSGGALHASFAKLAAGEQAPAVSAKAMMQAAIEEAIACGMVPDSSAREGGAARHVRQVQVADMLRDALAAAKAEG